GRRVARAPTWSKGADGGDLDLAPDRFPPVSRALRPRAVPGATPSRGSSAVLAAAAHRARARAARGPRRVQRGRRPGEPRSDEDAPHRTVHRGDDPTDRGVSIVDGVQERRAGSRVSRAPGQVPGSGPRAFRIALAGYGPARGLHLRLV